VRRLALGVTATVVPVARQLARELDLLNDRAVEVVETLPGGSAAAAGLRSGDLIVTANGRIVSSVDDLHRVLAKLPLDRAVTLGVVRLERMFELEVEARGDGA
jgi:S1-C subfamily serine protease